MSHSCAKEDQFMLEMYSAKQGSMELTNSANQVICRAKTVRKRGTHACRVVVVLRLPVMKQKGAFLLQFMIKTRHNHRMDRAHQSS